MANHLRRQIRDAVAAAVTGLATTGSHVFLSRVYPIDPNELPALFVYTTSESANPMTLPLPRLLQRSLIVRVDAIAMAVADIDDTLDQICKEVEVALTPSAVTMAKMVTLESTDISMDGESERPIGKASMTFSVVYFSTEHAPDVAY